MRLNPHLSFPGACEAPFGRMPRLLDEWSRKRDGRVQLWDTTGRDSGIH